MTNSSVESVDTKGKGCSCQTEKGEEKIDCDVVLSAVGTKSNIENIGLEELGIVVDNGKILVNDFYKQIFLDIMRLETWFLALH